MIYDENGKIHLLLFVIAPVAFVYFLAAIFTVIAKSPVLLTAMFVIGALSIAFNCIRLLILSAYAVAHKIGGGK